MSYRDPTLGNDANAIQFEDGTHAPSFTDVEVKNTTTHRLWLALEGGRTFRMEDGGALMPGLELGFRRDGSDTETGAGVFDHRYKRLLTFGMGAL